MIKNDADLIKITLPYYFNNEVNT